MALGSSSSQLAWDIRNAYISLPSKSATSDYKHLLLVGRTGAGKTTLVRQLLGISHNDNFPPTSQNRTTVADFEVVFTEKNTPYKCVVTFLEKKIVYEYIKDCLFEAANSFAFRNNFSKAYSLFMEHKTQRFRLKYILGDASKIERDGPRNSFESAILSRWIKYKKYIVNISECILKEFDFALDFFGKAENNLSVEENKEIKDYIFSTIVNESCFIEYCNSIIDDVIELIFDAGKFGKFENEDSGWPKVFTYEDEGKSNFITNILNFCGNSAKKYGNLASPVVSGMRISGPFQPKWTQHIPKLVIIDGEGIGHKSDRKQSIPTSITEKYALVDNILLIDSATEPMLGESQSAILSVITHGYSEELLFAFTKFDSVVGVNYQDDDDKKQHILRSIENFADSCSENENLEVEIEDILEKISAKKTVFLSSLDTDISIESPLKDSLLTLLNILKISFFSDETHHLDEVYPDGKDKKKFKEVVNCDKVNAFEEDKAIKILKTAIQNFHDKWNCYLNFGSPAQEPAQHWTRIKALARRVSEFGWDGYDDLQPVADAVDFLQKSIFVLLKQNNMDIKTANMILKLCSQENQNLCRLSLITQEVDRWYEAYQFSGFGSTRNRAVMIQSIYMQSMPATEDNTVIKKIIETMKIYCSSCRPFSV